MVITGLELSQALIDFLLGLLCIILVFIISSVKLKNRSGKFIIFMFVATFILFMSDAGAYIFRGNVDKFSLFFNRLCNFLSFLANIVLLILSMKYVSCLLEENERSVNKIFIHLLWICALSALTILVINIPTNWMYYFDELNYYHRNIGWYLYTILNMLGTFILIVAVLVYRRQLHKKMVMALITYIFIPIASIIIQIFYYGISFIPIGIFISLLLVLIAYFCDFYDETSEENAHQKFIELVVLFSVTTITMTASIISCIVSLKSISDDNREENSMVLTHMVYDEIDNEFTRPLIITDTMSSDYFLRKYIEEGSTLTPEEIEENIVSYLKSVETGFGYQMLYVVNSKTNCLYSTNGFSNTIDEGDLQDLWYYNFISSGKEYVLEVDNDEANGWNQSVFINREIRSNGSLLGVCGLGIEMSYFQSLIVGFEEKYNLEVYVVDENGMIQICSDSSRIKNDYLDNSYFNQIKDDGFYYENLNSKNRLTRYMDNLGWYIVVIDNEPNKIYILDTIIPSVAIFIVGLIALGITFFVISYRNRRTEHELLAKSMISITDQLTGLFNRYAYEKDINNLEDDLSNLTVIMMDLNGLKYANDNFGHLVGDEFIVNSANSMQQTMGKYGKVYRIGGDEFVSILKCSNDELTDLIKTFEYLTQKWEEKFQNRLSVSKGIVICNEFSDLSFNEIIKIADDRMYMEKDKYYQKYGFIKRII